ncbi:GNAT family N-acetyltransferase [Pelagibius sp.]|uniref:GNAT family N-acetyltransferase n=1 Tax=Pelagibius sp. TaxID=1931238 RepID=UPI003BB02438
MTKLRILTSYKDVAPFLDSVQALADSNRQSLGFFPAVVYHDLAAKGSLWVALSGKSDLAGFLTFGGSSLQLGVKQLFVDERFRGRKVGTSLVDQLIKYAEARDYLSIRARVATDLKESNAFWESVGFQQIKREAGGKSRNREIFVRVRTLRTRSLLSWMDGTESQRETVVSLPRMRVEVTKSRKHFAIDLNVFFDVTKNRKKSSDAGSLIGAAMAGLIDLSVTSEFLSELKRSKLNRNEDPILQFAESLPVLPPLSASADGIVSRLREIIFPHRDLEKRRAPQEQSDLLHIASSIQYRLDGFITRDGDLLRAAESVKDEFGIEIVAPADLVDPSFEDIAQVPVMNVTSKDQRQIIVQQLSTSEEKSAIEFLVACGHEEPIAQRILRRGTSASPREVHAAYLDGLIIAVASWDHPTTFHEGLESYLVVDETAPLAQQVIDHFIELIVRTATRPSVSKCRIELLADQPLTMSTAQSRGFGEFRRVGAGHWAEKPMAGRIVTEDDWVRFQARLSSATGLRLPSEMPSFEGVRESGIEVSDESGLKAKLTLFDLETLLSPVLFLFSKRGGLILPIRSLFARDLLGDVGRQYGLLPKKEAGLRLERAYFRTPAKTAMFKVGTPVIFYESGYGGGSKAAIGVARVTFSSIREVEDAAVAFERQGVLDQKELERVSRNGRVHVITFDNFNSFDRAISYDRLGDLIALQANLVAPQEVDSDAFAQICEEGFS